MLTTFAGYAKVWVSLVALYSVVLRRTVSEVPREMTRSEVKSEKERRVDGLSPVKGEMMHSDAKE